MATDFVQQVKRLMSCGYTALNADAAARQCLREKGEEALEEYVKLNERLYADTHAEEWT